MTTTLKRGDRYADGLYVGTTKAGVEWVARKNAIQSEKEAFDAMCERFDASHTVLRYRMAHIPTTVMNIAQDCAFNGAEAGVDYCQSVEFKNTCLTAERDFFVDLIDFLMDHAKELACGNATVNECMENRALAEAADRNMAKCLRKWAARIRHMIGLGI